MRQWSVNVSSLAKPQPTTDELVAWVRDARWRTIALVDDLDEQQWLGPQSEIVNPPLWEVGHVAWFAERWVLRHAAGRAPMVPECDRLYDSAGVDHNVRWDLHFPTRDQTLTYLVDVRDAVLEVLDSGVDSDVDERLRYFVMLSVFHEDMHTEAFTYTRHTHGYPPPCWLPSREESPATAGNASVEDVEVPGGTFLLGSTRDEPFVFDNEQWAHPVDVQPFRMCRTAVTQGEFAQFVEDGAYERGDCWSADGLCWRTEAGVASPSYWQREPSGRWLRRDFDRWVTLEPEHPVMHVNWYEAEAYCRWAGRRLPTEAEWEAAAAANVDAGRLSQSKRRYAWGDDPPDEPRANLDWRSGGTVGVNALPGGDTPHGCRQMIGNVWEWTASDFQPYPSFEPGPYREYSKPWFGDHKVLRGGCWCTRSRLIHNTYRNFYQPHRRDVWAGFRTCAVEM